MRRLAALTLAGVLLAGCGGYDATVVPEPDESAAAAAGPNPSDDNEECENDGRELISYDPGDGTLDGTAVRRIRDRGRLIAGVAADTYLLGARSGGTGVVEGFDIDMVNAIAQSIWPDESPERIVANRVELKVITAADRIRLLQDGDHPIDIVSRNMTVNCDRWQDVAFSQIYYDAGQKVLVGKDTGIESIEDLAGKRVCAPAGTTSIDNIRKIQPDAIPVSSTDNSACMILFQNGEADGVSTDDTVLAGLAAQDPYATVLKTEFLTSEPYGIAANSDDVDLVRLINKTLEDMRRDGRWQGSYKKWLQGPLGVPGVQPEPRYGQNPWAR
ncbi:glutamate ABC transporter substrate-binding protein [Nocardioides lianchengensis]|uniref:Polar amino acid transport system substrate-binding protein n=1 Tax=Nocardioides lianchengensis TaxID=1045774 RepID=A0A1G6NNQ4_9ACTN|nr:glutamate ABC transporter substrate-binding protein [Nocardioides lianchengensis]NYG10820.1 polar amino acid transport system substrate-binding protein [Nocardioides lianchengensis]SDC68896.1 polar amino acid transport system substrate-binding protein [Nocardioides lianchengensis]